MASDEFWPNGRLKPIGMKVVAERAGVAISSVSRVLSGHPDVSSDMRARVLDAVTALGYEPDMLAQSLRTGETRTIGFVVSDLSNPLFALMAHGAEIELRARGYSVLVANSLNNDELALRQIRHMHQRRVDALMVSAGDERDGPISEVISRSPVPTTLIDRRLDAPNASHVLSHHKTGMTAAAEHLIALGHRRIALINGAPDVLPAELRAKALRRVAAKHPPVQVSVHAGTFSQEHGDRTVTALFASDEPPTAIIAGSNQILVGVLAALFRLSLRMPDDVSLITCDGLPLAEFLTPSLGVIWRDAQLLGMRAAQVMLEHLESGEPRNIRLPTEYRPAGSTGTPRLALRPAARGGSA